MAGRPSIGRNGTPSAPPGPSSHSRLDGLVALAKCILLLVGTPAALARVWMLEPPTGQGRAGVVRLALHVLLVAMAICWLVAGSRLVGDFVRALRGREPTGTSWSWRWAAALAGLLLAATATTRALGTTPAPAGSGQPVAAVSVVRSPTAPSPTGTAGRGERAGHGELAGIIALLGVGLLGGSAIARRTRLLRRLSECLRSPGERLPEPDEQTAWTEALLGPLGDADLIDWIEAANRLLWRSLREDRRGSGDGPPMPDIRLVRAGFCGVELLLDQPIEPAPDGFVALDGGRRWLLDPDLDLDELEALTAGSGRLLAGLIPVGEDDQASYLVPVGPDRRLALLGDEQHCKPVLAYLLVALRTLPWAEELAIELIGCAAPDPDERCYQLNASSFAELEAIAGRPVPAGDRLAATWSRTPLVVVGRRPSADQERILEVLVGSIGVISVGAEGTERLVIDDRGAYLEPLGIELDPPRPTPGQLATIDALLQAASQPPITPEAILPSPPCPPAPATGRPPTAGRQEVRLLDGAPRIEGEGLAPVPRDGGRALEVITYLVLHDHGATVEQLQASVFRRPGGTASAARVHNVCSVARRLLGADADGRSYLRADPTAGISLDPAITCDWTRFRRLVGSARGLPGHEAGALLEAALDLVGEPPWLAGANGGWRWFAAEGFGRELVSTVVDAAHHLASLSLATGDVGKARLAIARGRLLEPASELLVRDLLVACELEGDQAALEQAYRELESALDSLGGQEPSATTRALFDSLDGHRPPVDA